MRKNMKKLLLMGLLVGLLPLLFLACGEKNEASQSQQTTVQESESVQSSPSQTSDLKKAPNFALQDAEGKTVQLSDFAGKVVVLNFWATWCGPCRTEIPGFVRLYSKYQDKGLVIVGISVDQKGWSVVKPFMKQYKINYPILMANQQVVLDYGGIQAIPTTFIINQDGEIVEKLVGLRPETYFENRIQQLLN